MQILLVQDFVLCCSHSSLVMPLQYNLIHCDARIFLLFATPWKIRLGTNRESSHIYDSLLGERPLTGNSDTNKLMKRE